MAVQATLGEAGGGGNPADGVGGVVAEDFGDLVASNGEHAGVSSVEDDVADRSRVLEIVGKGAGGQLELESPSTDAVHEGDKASVG